RRVLEQSCHPLTRLLGLTVDHELLDHDELAEEARRSGCHSLALLGPLGEAVLKVESPLEKETSPQLAHDQVATGDEICACELLDLARPGLFVQEESVPEVLIEFVGPVGECPCLPENTLGGPEISCSDIEVGETVEELDLSGNSSRTQP